MPKPQPKKPEREPQFSFAEFADKKPGIKVSVTSKRSKVDPSVPTASIKFKQIKKFVTPIKQSQQLKQLQSINQNPIYKLVSVPTIYHSPQVPVDRNRVLHKPTFSKGSIDFISHLK